MRSILPRTPHTAAAQSNIIERANPMLHTKIWSYALDSKHGFGILSNFSANTDSAPCFFEDGTLENVRPSDVYMDNSVNNLLAEGSGRGHYYNAKETRLADTIAAKAVCTFSRGKENSLQAVLSHGSEKVTITVSLQRYSYATSCSCGKPRCIHPLAAGRILNDRINGLIHSYVITDHPVIPLYGLIVSASLAARAGLTEAEALRCVTLSGAEHLGIEDRVGSIEKGKDADLVLWNGNPLDTRFHPVMTMIDGSVEYDARS